MRYHSDEELESLLNIIKSIDVCNRNIKIIRIVGLTIAMILFLFTIIFQELTYNQLVLLLFIATVNFLSYKIASNSIEKQMSRLKKELQERPDDTIEL